MRNDVKVMQMFVDQMVGIPKFSYPAKKNAPRPEGEFADIQLIEQYVTGLPVTVPQTEVIVNGEVVGCTYRKYSAVKLRFRVTVVETTGIPSTQIGNGWTTEAMKALMISTGYGYISCKPISLEDAKLETVWEPREGFSVELSTTRVIEETINNIGQVTDINGEVYQDGLETIFLNIEVNP